MVDDTQHIFGVRCHACEHVTYFDKRRVCGDVRDVQRGAPVAFSEVNKSEIEPYVEKPTFAPDKKLYRLLLECEACDKKIIVAVDCEEYL